MARTAAHPWYEGLPNPAVIAHRGASIEAPENTLAAFTLAASRGADAVELDVMLCATGEPVVIHDDTVDRTTNGTGEVAAHPLAALKELDAGEWFDEAYSGERIPTIDEVFDTVADRVFINIELKNFRRPLDAAPEVVAGAVRRHGLARRVFFSSFNPFALRAVRRLLPESPAGLLLVKGLPHRVLIPILGLITGHDAIHPERSQVTEALVRRSHAQGKPIYTYTVNTQPEMERLLGLNIDGIITDDPALAVKTIAGSRH